MSYFDKIPWERCKLLIYFAHPLVTYGSQLEKEALKVIEKNYTESEIINPAKIQSTDMEVFFDQVRLADIVIFTTTVRRWIGKGVFDEIQLAQSLNKKILFLEPVKQQFFQDFKIEEHSKSDWQNYAKIRVRNEDKDRIVVIDTETTGLDPSNNEIVEIAAIALDCKTYQYQTLFNSLCNPGLQQERLEKTWVCIEGLITPDEILMAQEHDIVAQDFLITLGDNQWTTFNLNFDSGFLQRKPWLLPETRLSCIMEVAKPVCALPHDLYDYKYPRLDEAYSIIVRKHPLTGHRALTDATMATEILIWLIKNNYYNLE